MEIELSRDDSVLTITLNRPEVLNAFDRSMHEQLSAALQQSADPAVRAVVVTGAGRGFCVGQDVAEFPADPRDVGELLRRNYNPNMLAIRALEKPVIAAVNGVAAGAGLALALACDIRLAADTASLVPAFIGIGLVPDSGLSHTLPRIIGPSEAFEWLVSGEKLSAEQARARGLVSRVVPAHDLAAEAAAMAADLAARPTRAIAMTKRLLDASIGATLELQLEDEALMQTEAAAGEDFAEGVAAFREKRPARFTGR
ncbi:MAG: 2-(1,2-epoxy,2-dihydrophenyl)acetyl-CoA isomerase [Gaiellales bacterium]|jgi:2-(1,2-epoxy-1,2-dihydrophenyl)acetyl-CoA isomerase|nr:2-(1,2-epoxy,2-dihydrophenyl)acetyl-CoA isomerase [Gaiellales bacterium]